MYKRTILALALILGVIELVAFSSGSSAYAASAQSDSEAPPWGIAEVTDAALTPERIAAALPSTFGEYGFELEGGPDPAGQPYYPFATMSDTYHYIGASEVGSVHVNIADIGSKRTVAEAIDAARTLFTNNPYVERFEIEQRDTSATAKVPHLLMNVVDSAGRYYVLVWGAQDGEWVFTVAAGRDDNLQEFVRTLVASLQGENRANRNTAGAAMVSDDPEELFRLLAESSFPASTLPAGFVTATVTAHSEADGFGAVGWVYVDAREAMGTLGGGIEIFVHNTTEDARRAYEAHAASLESASTVWSDVTGLGYPTTLLSTSNSTVAAASCLILVNNVHVHGSYNAVDAFAPPNPSEVDANACNLAAAGVDHVEQIASQVDRVGLSIGRTGSSTSKTSELKVESTRTDHLAIRSRRTSDRRAATNRW